MKKLITAALALIVALGTLTSCSTADTNDENTYKVGICNYVDDASLNQIVDNIKNNTGRRNKKRKR